MTQKEKIQINKEYRKKDESHLWPIKGKFNATERAIKQIRKFIFLTEQPYDGIHYRALLDDFLSQIVNNPKNF